MMVAPASKEVFTGSKDIHIWWIDDCFIIPNLDAQTDGSLLLVNYDDWAHDNDRFNAPSLNHRVFIDLNELAHNQNVRLHLANFEYADANWEDLDKRNHLILLDIGYSGKFDAYGVDVWYRHSRGKATAAKIRFLSGDPSRVDKYCTERHTEPDTPPALAKEQAINFQNISDSRIAVLLRELINEQPTAIGELTCRQWGHLRENIKQAVLDYSRKQNMGEDKTWAHHLPTGGDAASNWTSKMDDAIAALRAACVHPVTKAPLTLPAFVWSDDFEPRWGFPPIRGLAQVDDRGHDLSRFFYHLQTHISGKWISHMDVLLTYPVGAFKHDYLWFNVVALGEAMLRLAEGFVGECLKAGGGVKGTMMWAVSEFDGENKGVEIVVRQFLTLDFPEQVEKDFGIVDRVRFVPRNVATKIVPEAYDFFDKAGCIVSGTPASVSYDWSIVIKAGETEGVWLVDCDNDGAS